MQDSGLGGVDVATLCHQNYNVNFRIHSVQITKNGKVNVSKINLR